MYVCYACKKKKFRRAEEKLPGWSLKYAEEFQTIIITF